MRMRCLLYMNLYLWSCAVLLTFWAVIVRKDPALWGEEVATSIRNVIFLEQHRQSDGYSTNFSSYVFYWLGSHIIPMSLQSMRLWKIFAVSLTGPIMAAILLRIFPRMKLFFAALPGLLFPLMGPVAFFSTLAVESGLECPFVFFLFYLALGLAWEHQSRSDTGIRLFVCSLLSAFALHIYGDAGSIIIAAWCVVFYRTITSSRDLALNRRRTALVGGLFIVTVVLSAWPLWYFQGEVNLLVGGGHVDLSPFSIWHSLHMNFMDVFVVPCTYEVGGTVPFGAMPWQRIGVVIAILAVTGALSARRYTSVAWIILAAAGSLALTAISGPTPGIRRSMPFVISLLLLAAAGFWHVWSTLHASHWGENCSVCSRVRRLFELSLFLVPAALILASLITFGQTLVFVDRHYQAVLARRFQSPKPFATAIEEASSRMPSERVSMSLGEYDFDYALLVHLLCSRSHREPCFALEIHPDGQYFNSEVTSALFVRASPPGE